MLPSDINTAARQRFNAVNDSFWSDSEVYNLLYAACLQAARETYIIETTSTLTSIASQQTYTLPSNTIAIKRVTYNGSKLDPVSMREDDAITTSNSITTATGTPQYYWIWNNVIYLRPLPSASSDTIKFFTYIEPALPTASSTLELPTMFHMDTVNFILSMMYAKDGNPQMAQFYMGLWDKALAQMRTWVRKRRNTDQFRHTLDEDNLPTTILGMV